MYDTERPMKDTGQRHTSVTMKDSIARANNDSMAVHEFQSTDLDAFKALTETGGEKNNIVEEI